MNSSEFWDDVHRKRWIPSLGETTAKEYREYFSSVGPFNEQLDKSEVVLDVGPGLGNFLRSLPDKKRLAVEVSPENRVKLSVEGVEAFAPTELESNVQYKEKVGVATCVSVFQHCTPVMVGILLKDVANVLAPGAGLYANGIINSFSIGQSDEENMRGGSFSHPLGEMARLAASAGLVIVKSAMYSLPAIKIDVWVARFERM